MPRPFWLSAVSGLTNISTNFIKHALAMTAVATAMGVG